MAKRNDGGIGGLFITLGIYVLPTLLAIIYFSSILYGVFLILPFLYYLTFGSSKLRKNQKTYADNYELALLNFTKLNRLKQQYSDLRVKNDGSYDERSNAGKQANSEVREVEGDLSGNIQVLNKLLGTYKNATFLKAAIWSYLIAILGLAFFQINEMYAPTIAVIFSLFIAFAARSVVAIETNNGELTPKRLPQINRKPFSLLLLVILMMNAFTLIVFVDENNELKSSFYTETETADISQEPDIEQNVTIIPLNPKSGFVLKDVEALHTPQNPAKTTKISNGSEVTITGEIKDLDLYEVDHSSVNHKLYVLKSSIAIFAE
jgi:hypothetical protein